MESVDGICHGKFHAIRFSGDPRGRLVCKERVAETHVCRRLRAKVCVCMSKHNSQVWKTNSNLWNATLAGTVPVPMPSHYVMYQITTALRCGSSDSGAKQQQVCVACCPRCHQV